MSREIELRCWNEHGKCFHAMRELGDKLHLFSNKNPSYVIEQFTGLLDCNGVKIFEGDIVEVDSESQCSTHAVEWCDNDYPAFDLYPRIDCESNGLSFALNALGVSIMVIGNIHQNSELLK